MRNKAFLMTSGALIAIAAFGVLVALPVSLALAQATPGALGDLIMPTSTPGGAVAATSVPGGFAIPTATPASGVPGGLFIPTATPIGGAVSAAEVLPRLSDEQLQALNISSTELGAPFSAGSTSVTVVEETIAQLEAASMTDVADAMRTLSQQYGSMNPWRRASRHASSRCR